MYYLLAVEEYEVVPVKLRTDKGVETLFMAEAQFCFREDQEGREIEVSEAHLFGPSTRNMKIESWWTLLVAAKVGHIKEMFEAYNVEGELFIATCRYWEGYINCYCSSVICLESLG